MRLNREPDLSPVLPEGKAPQAEQPPALARAEHRSMAQVPALEWLRHFAPQALQAAHLSAALSSPRHWRTAGSVTVPAQQPRHSCSGRWGWRPSPARSVPPLLRPACFPALLAEPRVGQWPHPASPSPALPAASRPHRSLLRILPAGWTPLWPPMRAFRPQVPADWPRHFPRAWFPAPAPRSSVPGRYWPRRSRWAWFPFPPWGVALLSPEPARQVSSRPRRALSPTPPRAPAHLSSGLARRVSQRSRQAFLPEAEPLAARSPARRFSPPSRAPVPDRRGREAPRRRR